MANVVIRENYSPNRIPQYVWEIRLTDNKKEKVQKLFNLHDNGAMVSVFSTDAFGWNEERQLWTTEKQHLCYRPPIEHLDLKDEYSEMLENNHEEFFNVFLNQWWQFRNMIRFTPAWESIFGCHVKGVIKTDGSHKLHNVKMFDERKFLEPFVNENNYFVGMH